MFIIVAIGITGLILYSILGGTESTATVLSPANNFTPPPEENPAVTEELHVTPAGYIPPDVAPPVPNSEYGNSPPIYIPPENPGYIPPEENNPVIQRAEMMPRPEPTTAPDSIYSEGHTYEPTETEFLRPFQTGKKLLK